MIRKVDFTRMCLPAAAMAALLFQYNCATGSFDKTDMKGPYIGDDLSKGTTAGAADGGSFTMEGWSPGVDGSIAYDMAGIAQGAVEIGVIGLDRTKPGDVFLTMFEPYDSRYADPYIVHNPYRVSVSLVEFEQAPESPFDFLWTIKNFPPGTDEDTMYAEGLPANVEGYEQTIASEPAPLYPDKEHTVRIEWSMGKARLYLDGTPLAEHNYRPLTYSPESLRLVIGKTPGADSFKMPDIVFTRVTVSLPGV